MNCFLLERCEKAAQKKTKKPFLEPKGVHVLRGRAQKSQKKAREPKFQTQTTV
jgi:hypothetical protein